jgi:hypothetical protein
MQLSKLLEPATVPTDAVAVKPTASSVRDHVGDDLVISRLMPYIFATNTSTVSTCPSAVILTLAVFERLPRIVVIVHVPLLLTMNVTFPDVSGAVSVLLPFEQVQVAPAL